MCSVRLSTAERNDISDWETPRWPGLLLSSLPWVSPTGPSMHLFPSTLNELNNK